MDSSYEAHDPDLWDELTRGGGQMTTPMYRDIADQLRQRIESGEFASDSQLPTEQDLQTEYGASRNTIR